MDFFEMIDVNIDGVEYNLATMFRDVMDDDDYEEFLNLYVLEYAAPWTREFEVHLPVAWEDYDNDEAKVKLMLLHPAFGRWLQQGLPSVTYGYDLL